MRPFDGTVAQAAPELPDDEMMKLLKEESGKIHKSAFNYLSSNKLWTFEFTFKYFLLAFIPLIAVCGGHRAPVVLEDS